MKSDWRANPNDAKARFVCLSFRLAHWARVHSGSAAFLPIVILYRFIVEWVMGIEIRPRTRVGAGLTIYHGIGLVVNDGSVLGNNITLRHAVTIGSREHGGASPVLMDDVEVGAGAMILGGITIGKGAQIGAGAIVVRSVPDHAVVRGTAADVYRP
ncbi:hypothetical protein B8W73_10770 [Arthrobacter agilis]|nr:hypothetical protein B8W73_10770 [Arthrobacter agilis]